ncbi:MAG: nucleotidyltransferase [Pseudomonadota bacterium]
MSIQPPSPKRYRLALEALNQRQDSQQWEEFIVAMLTKLELPKEKSAAAEKRYLELGRHVARKLGIGENDAHVVVQGSMRTQTTVAGDGRENFDLDVVVKLSGPRFEQLRESEQFFQNFGTALKGLDGAGVPTPMNRCWRLPYPGEPFYFDVTPAIPMSEGITGTNLRVRDPVTTWSPSNPQEFADWFCHISNKRFTFQQEYIRKAALEARTVVDPVPNGRIRIDDVLRRMVQLMKLHRDSYYKRQSDARQAGKPISVILVTLAAKAYDEMVTQEAHKYSSAIEVALELVERMPKFIQRGLASVRVDNPALGGTRGENFADKWNTDNGLRVREFATWHGQLMTDLEALFSEEYSKRSENRIHNVFGQHGVNAWKASIPSGVLAGLLSSMPAQPKSQPDGPRWTGYKDSLA